VNEAKLQIDEII